MKLSFSVSYLAASGESSWRAFPSLAKAQTWATFVSKFGTDVRVYQGRPGELRIA